MAEADSEELNVELETDEIEVDLEKDESEKKEKKPVQRVRLSEPDEEEEGTTEKAEPEVKAPDPVAEATAALEEARKRADAAAATAAAERQRREAAERQLQRAAKEVDAARTEAESAQLTLIEQGIAAAQSELAAYQDQVASAYEEGDFKKVADIQGKLSLTAARLDRLTAQKDDVVAAPKRADGGAVEQPYQPHVSSALEQYLSQFDPASQVWLRAHPECVPPELGGTQAANARMMQGHYAALAQNLQPSTPEYFKVIEEHTGHRAPVSQAAAVTPAAAEAPKAAQPKVTPSAPPSREVPSARDGRPQTPRSVRLTKEQQDMAKLSFPNMKPGEAYAAYARNLLELEAEGKIGRTTH